MRRLHCYAAAGLFVFAGCATPIGLERLPPRQAYIDIHGNALNSGRYSDEAELVLQRFDLERSFKKDPKSTLKLLHEKAQTDDRPDILYALSELSYRNADRLNRSFWSSRRRQARDYYFASSIYAYLYLFGQGSEAAPDHYDQRFRAACDFYNRGLALGLMAYGSSEARVEISSGTRATPFGSVQVRIRQMGLKWEIEDMEGFYSSDDFHVRGLTPRNRDSGLGAPLIAVSKKLGQYLQRQRAPATVFLRVTGDVKAWSAGSLTASLELYSSYEAEEVKVNGKPVPIQTDITAPIASALNGTAIYKLGTAQFFSSTGKIKNGIFSLQPYVPGRIPVVFVHGTASSPIWWAPMWNTLFADPVLRERYQFWAFSYTSGNPVTYSAALLRDDLVAEIKLFDPKGKDPALQEMVIIGHSQGGLLAKLTATDTGDKLWNAISDVSVDKLDVDPKTRALIKRNLFFTPLPFVKRVIFISTPHRGSFRSTNFVQNLLLRFMSFPSDVLDASKSLLNIQDQLKLPATLRGKVPNSLNGMSPKNPFMLALADIPVAPGIKANSIISIEGDDQPPAGNDGVVEYKSAHIDYAESEYIVRSPHSCQGNPLTIEEVRRILLEHLKEFSDSKETSQ